MACILHIETSTDVSSMAVSNDGLCVFDKVEQGNGKGSQASEKLGSMADEAMKAVEEAHLHLDAVAVSSGPGSYTGLRIGTSMAKGLAYGSDAKLLSVPTLQLLCVPLLLNEEKYFASLAEADKVLLCPMIDARRMEVFAALYDTSLNEVRGVQSDIVDADTYKEFLDSHHVFFFGNGAQKCKEVINHPNAHFVADIQPLAKNMMPLAEMRLRKGQYEDVAYFTPQYFKDYQAKLPKNLLKD
ncbi:MAG: tRNA (adenosine(37)-N6)-threonylcarbamoyltransferase complex dimerization subunit type 1 TsaB [Prevotella sp.]|nr:tRNA (adenosine(37)-N6)-threonylcarbamoyltransferase complex dimerization subunit type 1 TsaB [Prevotella sp.]